MGFIDVLIPLIIGIVFISIPENLVKANDPSFEKKKSQFRKIGFVLIGVGAIYFIIKMAQH